MNPWIVLGIYFALAVLACVIVACFEGPEDLEDA